MKLDKVRLKDFRGFGDVTVPLNPRLTVFAGPNGAGKSTVLDALALLLSWVVARIRSPGGQGRTIAELDIRNGSKYSLINAVSTTGIEWQIVKQRKGFPRPPESSEYQKVTEFARTIQENILGEFRLECLPLFVYYPVSRAVLDIPLRIRTKHEFSWMEAYDGALSGGANFRHFFEWFRVREDLENENFRHWKASHHREQEEPADFQLLAVRNALSIFLPDFANFSVHRNPLRFTALKKNEEIRVEQLSDGEKCMIAMVGDLARRLAIANQTQINPLEGEGIVLIDEIDLHLHPAWQRRIPNNLLQTFPNIQFIISTHSPQVLGEVESEYVRLLYFNEDNTLTFYQPEITRGYSSDEILDQIMKQPESEGPLSRNLMDSQDLRELFRMIDREDFDQARKMIEELKIKFHGKVHALVEADSLITMLNDGA